MTKKEAYEIALNGRMSFKEFNQILKKLPEPRKIVIENGYMFKGKFDAELPVILEIKGVQDIESVFNPPNIYTLVSALEWEALLESGYVEQYHAAPRKFTYITFNLKGSEIDYLCKIKNSGWEEE